MKFELNIIKPLLTGVLACYILLTNLIYYKVVNDLAGEVKKWVIILNRGII